MRKWKQMKTTSHQHRKNNCTRCGKAHIGRFCSARNSKCFKCGRFGHFSIVCNTKSVKYQKQKSEKRKQRDLQRLLTFNEKKNAMATFPFSDINNSDFVETMQSMDNTLKTELNVMKKRISMWQDAEFNVTKKLFVAESKLERSEREVDELKELNRKLCSPNKDLIRQHDEDQQKLKEEIRKFRTYYIEKVRLSNNLKMDVDYLTGQIHFKDRLLEEFKVKVKEYYELRNQLEKEMLIWKQKYETMCQNSIGKSKCKRGRQT